MRLKHFTSIVLLLIFKIINCQNIDIPIRVFLDKVLVENSDCLLEYNLLPKKNTFLLNLKYKDYKIKSILYQNEIEVTDSIYIYLVSKSKKQKANIHLHVKSKKNKMGYDGYLRVLDCSNNVHGIVLYINKEIIPKSPNFIEKKMKTILCRLQLFFDKLKY